MGPSIGRSSRNSTSEIAVLAMPTATNDTKPSTHVVGERRAPAGTEVEIAAPHGEPVRQPEHTLEVGARSKRFARGESGSSFQSTGTSRMRSPLCSARSNSSVSKNHASSATAGTSSRATSVRTALNPHCASRNRLENTARRIRL